MVLGLFRVLTGNWQRRKRKPLRLRDRLRGVNLGVERNEARRGDGLSVTLTHAEGADDLEVGLVCSELYDYVARAQTKGGTINILQTGQATAYEQWHAIEPGAGEQTLTIEIPRDAPYSYEGDCVSYAWRVSARRVRMLRSDPRIDVPICVAW